MVELGFTQGIASPCLFVHFERGIVTSVHGDYLASGADKRQLDWIENALEAKYELKRGGRLGPGKNDKKEMTVLNGVLRYTDLGFEYEADPRQYENMIE